MRVGDIFKHPGYGYCVIAEIDKNIVGFRNINENLATLTLTWECPLCGDQIVCDYYLIVDIGLPVCENCDCDYIVMPNMVYARKDFIGEYLLP